MTSIITCEKCSLRHRVDVIKGPFGTWIRDQFIPGQDLTKCTEVVGSAPCKHVRNAVFCER